MSNEIYLRPFTDEAGNVFIVDQDGRKVHGQRFLTVTADMDEPVSFVLDCLATKPLSGSVSKSWFNGKASE